MQAVQRSGRTRTQPILAAAQPIGRRGTSSIFSAEATCQVAPGRGYRILDTKPGPQRLA
jgi:hypothetical protein